MLKFGDLSSKYVQNVFSYLLRFDLIPIRDWEV